MSVKTATFRSDYRAPDFFIKTVDLTFHLHDTATRVVNTMHIEPRSQCREIILHGENLELVAVSLNGEVLPSAHYQSDEKSLTLTVPEEPFELTIETQINPSSNQALEGLYKSGGAFCTQCEAEGFRRITYYLDRPDILAQFTTTIIANQADFPYLLSNGNAIADGNNTDG